MVSKKLPLPLLALFIASLGLAFSSSGSADSNGKKEVTFAKDVAPIFYNNCAECHRPGEAAPMSLLTYKEARP
ncbi:MAG TPA: ascorbate-dependent monooxygenase, partial [Blastocatellia bacterium]